MFLCHLDCVGKLKEPLGRLPNLKKCTVVANILFEDTHEECVQSMIDKLVGKELEVVFERVSESGDW
jgi:hypothetical protein